MSAVQSDDCQINDLNNLFPMAIESLKFPLDSTMRIIFTGYYNGFSVEVRSPEEMAMLHHMGCFGKGSMSRSKPRMPQNDGGPCLMRKRQFCKRNYWYKKFNQNVESAETDTFFRDIDVLAADIIKETKKAKGKDVIDLVSSDTEHSEEIQSHDNVVLLDTSDKQDIAVVVPNSDSEGDNYFEKFKPECCLNKIKIHEKLMLTLQEAFFLSYGLGCLQIMNSDDKILSTDQLWELFIKTDRNFIHKYVVYHYFRSKGYIVKSGIKFGGDYCEYKNVGTLIFPCLFLLLIASQKCALHFEI
jgi:tRNA splicing endonuclease